MFNIVDKHPGNQIKIAEKPSISILNLIVHLNKAMQYLYELPDRFQSRNPHRCTQPPASMV